MGEGNLFPFAKPKQTKLSPLKFFLVLEHNFSINLKE